MSGNCCRGDFRHIILLFPKIMIITRLYRLFATQLALAQLFIVNFDLSLPSRAVWALKAWFKGPEWWFECSFVRRLWVICVKWELEPDVLWHWSSKKPLSRLEKLETIALDIWRLSPITEAISWASLGSSEDFLRVCVTLKLRNVASQWSPPERRVDSATFS